MTESSNTLTQSFKRLRMTQGLGQRALARASGVAQPTISRIENGGGFDDIKFGTTRRLFLIMGIDLEEILLSLISRRFKTIKRLNKEIEGND